MVPFYGWVIFTCVIICVFTWWPFQQESCLIHWHNVSYRIGPHKCLLSAISHAVPQTLIHPSILLSLYWVGMLLTTSNREPDYSGLNRDFFFFFFFFTEIYFSHLKRNLEISNRGLSETQPLPIFLSCQFQHVGHKCCCTSKHYI